MRHPAASRSRHQQATPPPPHQTYTHTRRGKTTKAFNDSTSVKNTTQIKENKNGCSSWSWKKCWWEWKRCRRTEIKGRTLHAVTKAELVVSWWRLTSHASSWSHFYPASFANHTAFKSSRCNGQPTTPTTTSTGSAVVCDRVRHRCTML